eukprot:TRINITY_DN7187_c0_g1_i2.p1 TRINITY_DN7187_c0_g1~~TRINITY_DN7187_c0_g1_i2.p1  ORF type:complete len:451 (+),score=112.42 TRINITY_DN7187_c0_g1_i2:90-1442(+)
MFFFFLMIRQPPRSTLSSSSAASDVYKRQGVLQGLVLILLCTAVLAEWPESPPSYSDSVSSPHEDYTERSSWTDQMKQAFAGMAVGILMLCVSFPFMFWNEGRAVVRSAVLDLGEKTVVSLDRAVPLPENNGRLIATAGALGNKSEAPKDPLFQISAPAEAVKLRRSVQMYQWDEHKKDEKDSVGGGVTTRYSYKKTWSTHRIDSSSFKVPNGHANPTLGFQTQVFHGPVMLGGFDLAAELVGALTQYSPHQISPTALPRTLPVGSGKAAASSGGKTDYGATKQQRTSLPVHWEAGDAVFVGRDPSSPDVGDYKVSFSVVHAGEYSVLGGQRGSMLCGYTAEEITEPALPCCCSVLCCAGAGCVRATSGVFDSAMEAGVFEQNDADSMSWVKPEITTLRAILPGRLTAHELLSVLSERNSAKSFLYRALGYLMMTLGLSLIHISEPTRPY